MKTITLKGEVLSSFCIWNGSERGILDYFFRNHWKELAIVSENWIFDAILQKKVNKDIILKAIEKGDFKTIDALKRNIKIDESWIQQTIPLKDEAFRNLSQTWWANNQGLIKQQISNTFLDTPIIPWSTIKGIIRTAWLVRQHFKMKIDLRTLEENNKAHKSIDEDLFKWIQIPDIPIENAKLSIQRFTWYGKPTAFSEGPKKGLWLNVTSVDHWTFEIPIQIDDHLYSQTEAFWSNFDEILNEYADTLIGREASILENIKNKSGFEDLLDEHLEQGQYPIKIGMYKKSLSYKIDWNTQISELNKRKGKERQKESRIQWIWDKVLYLNEAQQPVWWILLYRT